KTKFERYRLSFDISSMNFYRSNPNGRSRDNRTMDIQAMHAVADSLKHQIRQEVKHTSQRHPVFLHHYSSNRKKDTNHSPPHSQSHLKPPYKSNYVILQMASNKTAQLRLFHSTLERLHNYQSSYRNLEVNVQWRSSRI